MADEVSFSRQPIDSRANDNYNLYDFLEDEYKRLMCIDAFLTKKLNTYLLYSQTEILLQKQKTNMILKKDKLFEILKEYDSPMNQQLEKIFNDAY